MISITPTGDETFVAEGNEYYFGLFSNFEPASPFFTINRVRLYVNPVGSSQTDFIVSVAGSTTSYVAPTEVSMDASQLLIDSDTIRDRAVLIQSSNGDPLSVITYVEEFTSSDTFKALPCVNLPVKMYEYYAVSVPVAKIPEPEYDDYEYEDYMNDNEFQPPIGNSAIVIVTTEIDTELTMTLTQNVTITAANLLEQVPGGMFEVGVSVTI